MRQGCARGAHLLQMVPQRTESERAVLREPNVARQRTRAQCVARVVDAAEPGNSVVLTVCRQSWTSEHETQWIRDRDQPRDRIRGDAGAEQRVGVSAEIVAGSLALRRDVERDVVGDRRVMNSPSAPKLAANAALGRRVSVRWRR